MLIVAILSVRSCRKAATWLIQEDLTNKADALVFLMGSFSDRVLQTDDLYKQGLADQVLIVKASNKAAAALEARGIPVVNETRQVCDALVALGIPEDKVITIPGDATSTQMEAMIVREYILNHTSLDSLILVSSPFHTRRASLIFKTAFKNTATPVCIFSSPSSYSIHDAEKWWRSREMVQRVLMEYMKLANFVLFEKSDLKKE